MITVRRGGTLTDQDHRALAWWAATCAEHVRELFESEQPDDPRVRLAIEQARGWIEGRVGMMAARAAGGHAMGAARPLTGAARFAAYAAGQAACVPHVAEHDLGAAAYAIKAVEAAALHPTGPNARPGDPASAREAARRECRWQREQLPQPVRALVLQDQARRNEICWSVFQD